jgi:hypothetical protein
MLGNLISLSEDLKQYPDQWLMREVQNPSGAMPPYLILSELQRRKLLRSGAASAPAPASSVAQDTVRDTLQQITPPPPAGPPPPPGMASPARNPPQPGGPMPGAQPPGNVRMQEGGLYDEDGNDGDNILTTPQQPGSIEEMIRREANLNKLDPKFMRSVAATENATFDPKAVSPAGAIGVMQLMPGTARGMHVDPYNPQQNVSAGAKILRGLMDKYNGDINLVLAAYNAGEGAVARYGGVPPYEETHNYINKVTALMKHPTARMNQPTREADGETDEADGDAETQAQNALQPTRAQLDAPLDAEAQPYTGPAPAGGLGALAPPPPWQPVTPQTLIDAREQEKAASQRLHDLITGHKSPFDPENLARNKASMEAAGIHRPDYSKEDEAVAEAMKAAKQGLHPSISQILLQMGMGLLASRSPHFGTALGEAGMGTLAGVEKRRAAARDDYVAALRAGIDLSSKKNSYDEKMAELNYAQAKAEERSYAEQQKEAEKEQAAAHKERVKAETDALKAQTPDSWEKVLLNPGAYPPEARAAAAAVRDSLHPPKAATAAKPPAAPTQMLNAQVKAYSYKNKIPLDESNPDFLSQLPPEKLQDFMDSLPKSEAVRLAQEQKEAAVKLAQEQKEATQLQASRRYHETYLEKESKPINDRLGRVENAIQALDQHTEVGDAAASIELVTATGGGAGSGVKVTQPEINAFTKNRSASERFTGMINHWISGTLFEPVQRQNAKQILQRYKNKLEAAQEAISNGGYRLANSDDWKKEHWSIHNQVRDELNAIGDNAVSLRDSKGKLRHFNNVENLPHANGQSLANDPHAVDLFRDAAGGDPEMIQSLARHWGWRVD